MSLLGSASRARKNCGSSSGSKNLSRLISLLAPIRAAGFSCGHPHSIARLEQFDGPVRGVGSALAPEGCVQGHDVKLRDGGDSAKVPFVQIDVELPLHLGPGPLLLTVILTELREQLFQGHLVPDITLAIGGIPARCNHRVVLACHAACLLDREVGILAKDDTLRSAGDLAVKHEHLATRRRDTEAKPPNLRVAKVYMPGCRKAHRSRGGKPFDRLLGEVQASRSRCCYPVATFGGKFEQR